MTTPLSNFGSYRANNLSKAARKAIKVAGLSTPATFDVMNVGISPAPDCDLPMIRAYSANGEKVVTVTASDIFCALAT
jgi:hypothetical protein